jgi:hypothetical protein
MRSFKQYILNEYLNVKPVENEAMLVLQKIIDMVDDGHVDYDSKRIKINVGTLIKNKKYKGLNIFIVKGSGEPKIGRHQDEESHAIFLYADRMPAREKIDNFLADQERSTAFKSLFKKFFNDAVFDGTDEQEGSAYEQGAALNTRTNFEKSYVELVSKLNDESSKYMDAKKEMENRIERSNDDLGHGEVLKLGLTKLKKEMVGSNVNEFKSKAIELYGKDKYKMLNPEFKTKLDSRLEDYFEHKFK